MADTLGHTYGVQTDERGRPFIQLPGQARNYLSPAAMGQSQPPKLANDGGGILHGRWGWNQKTGEWEQKLSGGKILTYAVAAALTAGAISALAPAVAAAPTAAGATVPTVAAPTVAGVVTPAVVAPAVAKAGMSARNWLDAAIFGTKTITDVYGAKQSAAASDRAAEIQAKSAAEALALVREQWEKYNKDYEPFLRAGTDAIGRLSTGAANRPVPVSAAEVRASLANYPTSGQYGQPRPTPTPAPTLGGFGRPPVSTTIPVLGAPRTEQPVSTTMPVGNGGSVKMQAPTGEIQDVPAEKVAHYLSRGASRVG